MCEQRLCSADMPVMLPVSHGLFGAAIEMPAKDWADRLGIAWDTVRQRRYRGDPWTSAFQPCLRRTPFNNSLKQAPGRREATQTITGALQMAAKLEIKIPTVAHIIVTGVSQPVHAAVMRRIQTMLAEEFGATVSSTLPAGPVGTAEEVGKSLWVVSQA
jgi:hypothetical protein